MYNRIYSLFENKVLVRTVFMTFGVLSTITAILLMLVEAPVLLSSFILTLAAVEYIVALIETRYRKAELVMTCLYSVLLGLTIPVMIRTVKVETTLIGAFLSVIITAGLYVVSMDKKPNGKTEK